MALDATGTPTSPDSIPKYNTAVDPPSGKGFNAAMDALQVALTARTTALAAKIDKPAGIVSGEAVVWDGAGWARSSVTRIGLSSITAGTAGDVLGGTGPSYSKPPGYEYNYSQFTAAVGVIATTEGTAETLVTSASITFDGSTAVWLEGFIPRIDTNAQNFFVEFFDGATALGRGDGGSGSVGIQNLYGVVLKRRLTPTVGAHTFTFKMWCNAPTVTARAGNGGVGDFTPGYIRVTKA